VAALLAGFTAALLDLLKQDPRIRSLALRQLRDAVGEFLEPIAYDLWHFSPGPQP
jgi:hypothetical protein